MTQDNDAGRVTTRELYNAQMETAKAITSLERRLSDRLRPLDVIAQQVADNKAAIAEARAEIHETREDMAALERRVRWWGGVSSTFAAGIAAFLAWLQSGR